MKPNDRVAYQHHGEVTSHIGTIKFVQTFLGFKRYLVQWDNGGGTYWYLASNLKPV